MIIVLSIFFFIYHKEDLEKEKASINVFSDCVEIMMIKLRYGNTNTFLITGRAGYLLIDTDYAGTLPAFYRCIKQNGVKVSDIRYVLATHYHPDHMGLIPEMMRQGVRLLLIDTQTDSVHFSDYIFARDRLPFEPIDEAKATVITYAASRAFLAGIGIGGEIIPTPGHSPDSISLMLDSGDCFVGDLQPREYGDEENTALQVDWNAVLRFQPRRILYAHANEKVM